MKEYIKSFVIGSSAPVFLPFFAGVKAIPRTQRNYSYDPYTFKAPLYFGVMNVISRFLGEKFNLSLKQRLALMGNLSPLMISTMISLRGAYNFDSRSRWIGQYLLLFLAHNVTFQGTIRYLEEALA